MKIGICSPINPYYLKDFLEDENILNVNGGASAVNTYVKELLKNGHKVIVFTSVVPSEERKDIIYKGKDLEVHIIHSNPGFFFSHALSRFYMIRRLRKYIGQHITGIDILHAQWTYDFALAAKAYENQLPVFCTVRDWAPKIISIKTGFKKIQWMLYNMLAVRVLNSEKIHFVANSPYTRDQILTIYPNKKITVIANPIDKDYLLDTIRQRTSDLSFISIASCANDKLKNISTLLRAYSIFLHKYPDSTLRLVGGGFTEENEMMMKYKKNGLLEGVILCGFKNHNDLICEIDKVNCLVHPSLEETFGNIIIEGMARGAIVIGGEKSGAVPQVLGNGEYGILCDVTDENALFEAMEKTMDFDYCKKITEKALTYTKENFSSYAVMEKHIELYNQTLMK